MKELEVPDYFVIYDGYIHEGWKTRDELNKLQEQKRVIWAKHKDNRHMEWGTDGVVKIIDENTVEIGGKEDKLKRNL